MKEPFVRVENLAKSFGRIVALSAEHPVSFNVDKDELLVVLGPTGAGKTTLLRTIAGLEVPDSGQIFIQGQSILSEPPAARDVARAATRLHGWSC